MFRVAKFLGLIILTVVVCSANIPMEYENRFNCEVSAAKAAEGIEASLFDETSNAMETAKRVQAYILSPKNFNKAMKLRKEAETDLKKGKDIKRIRKNLSEAASYFQKSLDATKLAKVTFTSMMAARRRAQTVEASNFAWDLWNKAEEKFVVAAISLEDGDVNKAREEAHEAESLYREARLSAIKVNYLSEPQDPLKQTDQLKVEKHAPQTLQRAKNLINHAGKELNENRYDTDVPRTASGGDTYSALEASTGDIVASGREQVTLASEGMEIEISGPTEVPSGVQTLPGRDVAALNSVVAQNLRMIVSYYENKLKTNPSLQGRVEIEFIVRADGHVTDVGIASSSLRDSLVERFITRNVKMWRFSPVDESTGDQTYRYPFIFRPQ